MNSHVEKIVNRIRGNVADEVAMDKLWVPFEQSNTDHQSAW